MTDQEEAEAEEQEAGVALKPLTSEVLTPLGDFR